MCCSLWGCKVLDMAKQLNNFFFFLFEYSPGSFPVGSEVENMLAHAGDPSSIPGSGSSFAEGNDNPLQYSCLGNHGQRRVTDYSPCVHKRDGHDLETKTQTISQTV